MSETAKMESKTAPPPGEITQVVEHLFRHESAKMLSALTRAFGPENLSLAEDVVQEALIRALHTWPFYGMPANPAAWMMQVAKNLAIDAVRRETVLRNKETQIVKLMELQEPTSKVAAGGLDGEIDDDVLRMMFVCCHPEIAPDMQIALALKTLCGFGIGEISKAFLSSEAAIAKRLTRAKQRIKEARIPFEVPGGKELSPRLDGVLHTIYLLFNEGYKASAGGKLVRKELCLEAIRLGNILINHPSCTTSKVHALLALMYLNAARLDSRTDEEGNLLCLSEQDRSAWDKALIARGMYHLANSASGDELSEYHLEAAIARCHCSATTYEETDWHQILQLYDHLALMDARPVVQLNRAIAIAKVHGPQAALESIRELQKSSKLESYYLLHAALGEFEAQLNRPRKAVEHFRRSMELADITSEQAFLQAKILECEQLALQHC